MELILVVFWGAVLWYIAVMPKEKVFLTWIILIIAIAISPLFAWLWPSVFN